MKSILIIGMGRFGAHLCMDLSKLDNEIMIVDREEEKLEDLLPYVTSAKIGDCNDTRGTLPGFERIRTEVETPFLAIAVCEVLHGCRQLVP